MRIVRIKRHCEDGKILWLKMNMGIQPSWGCRSNASIFEPESLHLIKTLGILQSHGHDKNIEVVEGKL